MSGDTTTLFEYLAEEVIGSEPVETLVALRMAASLPWVTEEMASPLAIDDKAAILFDPQRRNVYVTTAPNHPLAVRISPLVRDFLLERHRLDPDKEDGLLQAASAYYEEEGAMPEAMECLIALGSPGEVARFVSERGEAMLAAGMARRMVEAIELIPEESRGAEVLLYEGAARQVLGDWEGATACYEAMAPGPGADQPGPTRGVGGRLGTGPGRSSAAWDRSSSPTRWPRWVTSTRCAATWPGPRRLRGGNPPRPGGRGSPGAGAGPVRVGSSHCPGGPGAGEALGRRGRTRQVRDRTRPGLLAQGFVAPARGPNDEAGDKAVEAAGVARSRQDLPVLAEAMELESAPEPNPVKARSLLEQARRVWVEIDAPVESPGSTSPWPGCPMAAPGSPRARPASCAAWGPRAWLFRRIRSRAVSPSVALTT